MESLLGAEEEWEGHHPEGGGGRGALLIINTIYYLDEAHLRNEPSNP